MISRYEVWLNNVPLSGIDDRLAILDISYDPVAIQNKTSIPAGRNGSMVTARRQEKTAVTVTFELHIYNTQERQQVCQQVAAWAMHGGMLKTSDRPGQRLRCVCDNPPVISSALKWTDALSVSFGGYVLPYWEQDVPSRVTTNDETTLFVAGNALQDAFVEVTVTPTVAITRLTVTAGETEITLSGINIPAEQTVKFWYDDDMFLHIDSGATGLLSKRSAASDDDLLIPCNKRSTVAVSASGAVSATFSARGLWV